MFFCRNKKKERVVHRDFNVFPADDALSYWHFTRFWLAPSEIENRLTQPTYQVKFVYLHIKTPVVFSASNFKANITKNSSSPNRQD